MSEFNILTSCCQPSDETQENTTINKELPIAIIGAGPVGLAAAAHLIQYKQKVIVLEAGTEVGANILTWKHIRLFSQWKYNIDKAASSLLEKYKWEKPNLEEIPTGKELVENYLIPLSKIPEIQEVIALNTKVISIARKNIDKMKTAHRENVPFVIYTEHEGSTIQAIEARAVIDATGTWGNPNPANSSGVWLESEKNLKKNIFYGLPDILGESISRYKNKKVAVIGSGHSAINALLELGLLKEMHPGTEILWFIRKERVEDAYGGEEKDALEARGLLGSKIHEMVDKGVVQVYTSFRIEQLIKNNTSSITIIGEIKGVKSEIKLIDEVIVNTGNRPNYSFLDELRTKVDFATESVEALSPLIDPNLHSCGTVRPHGERELRQPEKDLYIVGSKSYGRAPTFLMATGYEQVRSIAAYMAGDIQSSEKVELDLPETGVCSVTFSNINPDNSCTTDSCCS